MNFVATQEIASAGPPKALMPVINALRASVSNCNLHREVGAVTDVTASRIVTTMRNVFVGEKCYLRLPESNRKIATQVVAIENEHAILAPLEPIDGLARNAEVMATGESFSIHVGEELVGRVLDGLGQPLDKNPLPIDRMIKVPVVPKSVDTLDRGVIDDVFQTGVRTIDGFNTIGHGQRMAIFGEAGAGKTTLLSMLARNAEADVVVLAMIGERGREVNEFLERQLPEEVRKRCVVVVSTSDRPALERIMAAHCASTIAETFRENGKNVLMLFDSMTRYARALREVGLSAGEQAVRSGFTPSVYAELPRLVERSGKDRNGAITAFYTVLVENNGVNDPIAEEVASLTDGHLALDAELARSGVYPAINVLKSKSRLMNEIADRDHVNGANELRKMLAKYQDMELLIQMGEYSPGSDPVADRAIELNEPIRQFMAQHTSENIAVHDSRSHLLELAYG